MSWLEETAKKLIEGRYGYKKHDDFSTAYAKGRNLSLPQRNAFAHAFLSAMITYENSETEARILGDERERGATEAFYSGKDQNYITDTYRDLYNNAVGRAIGKYAKANGLGQPDIVALIDDALRNGGLLVSIDRKAPDHKLPKIDRAGNPGGFTGWPKDFPNIPEVWKPPGFNDRFSPAYPRASFHERFEAAREPRTKSDILGVQRADEYVDDSMIFDRNEAPRFESGFDGKNSNLLGVHQSSTHDAMDQRRREIEAEMRKPRAQNAYWRDPEMQQEYRDLLERVESRPTSLLQPREGDAARKAEIEAEMRKGRHGTYFRSGSFLPEEYRAILERETGQR